MTIKTKLSFLLGYFMILLDDHSKRSVISALLQKMAALHSIGLCCLVILFSVSWASFALPEDHLQPIHVESERFNLDYPSGLAVYDGQVVAEQGSQYLIGDKLTIKSTLKGEVIEIVMTGNLAHYQCQISADREKVTASALTILYEPAKNLFTLIGNAEIEQQGNIFRGPIMMYNTQTQRIDSPSSDESRSSMVLKPL